MAELCMMFYDLCAVTLAYFFALWFRFDGHFTEIPERYLMAWVKFAPAYGIASIAVFWATNLYRSIWKFASFVELKRILRVS